MLGDGYRHPFGYVPLYPDTVPVAFWEGYRAAHARKMLRTNPYRSGAKYASWYDGWCYGIANLPAEVPVQPVRKGYKGRGEPY